MVSLGNIKKFFDDHPELSDRREAAMQKAKKISGKFGGIIYGGCLQEILGDLQGQFYYDYREDPIKGEEHVQISVKELRPVLG